MVDDLRAKAVELVEIITGKRQCADNLMSNEDVAHAALRAAVAAEREVAAAFADSWSKPSVVKLAAGEMTAQELRTAQAVARGIAAAIRARGSDQGGIG